MSAEFINSLEQVDATQWDRLFTAPEPGMPCPFTRHAFLSALELSGSASDQSGWQPHHLVQRDARGRLCGAMPLYQKFHSYGEYVFDWAWADAYAQAGLEYYPKLLSAIPYTPATGQRLAGDPKVKADLLERLQTELLERELSGAHVLFPDVTDNRVLHQAGWSQRRGCQFHWFNQNYHSFDEFLGQFSSRKRKNLKKERGKVAATGLRIEMLKAGEVSDADWQTFYALYHHTYLKRSGRYGYLNEETFRLWAQAFPEQLLMCRVADGEQMIAAALYFRDRDTLYGRYWGALEEIDGLHFEACYYRGIDYAIAQGISRFDPGAQGEHKIQRGFVPVATCSWHYLSHAGFRKGIDQFLEEESRYVDAYIADGRTYLPFRDEVPLPETTVLTGSSAAGQE